MNIKELRKQTGLSQRQFAEKFCLNLKTLQSWEQGLRHCPDYILYMIQKILEYEKSKEKEKKNDGNETVSKMHSR